ncbi:MAG: hypothetical protein JO362_14850 [Streptomycetaceae bacterium]|nr:hypothetical protein [Streptomycetaceae bacterium]
MRIRGDGHRKLLEPLLHRRLASYQKGSDGPFQHVIHDKGEFPPPISMGRDQPSRKFTGSSKV